MLELYDQLEKKRWSLRLKGGTLLNNNQLTAWTLSMHFIAVELREGIFKARRAESVNIFR